MAGFAQVMTEAGRDLGLVAPRLRTNTTTIVGVREGYPIQLAVDKEPDGTECLYEAVRFGSRKQDWALRRALLKGPPGPGGLHPDAIEVEAGLAMHKRPAGFRALRAEQVRADVDDLLKAVKQACPPLGRGCRMCGVLVEEAPVLIDDMVDRCCDACVERVRAERAGGGNQALRTAGAGIGVAIVGTLIWVAIAMQLHPLGIVLTAALSIVVGLAIGIGTSLLAGRERFFGWTVGGATLFAIVMGQLLYTGWDMKQQAFLKSLPFDWAKFWQNAPWVLASQWWLTLLAVAGGLLSATYIVGLAAPVENKGK